MCGFLEMAMRENVLYKFELKNKNFDLNWNRKIHLFLFHIH